MKLTGLKKAVGDYQNWTKQRIGHSADIMFDPSDGQIWADCFNDNNTYKVYQDENIVNLSSKILNTENIIDMKTVKKYAIELIHKNV